MPMMTNAKLFLFSLVAPLGLFADTQIVNLTSPSSFHSFFGEETPSQGSVVFVAEDGGPDVAPALGETGPVYAVAVGFIYTMKKDVGGSFISVSKFRVEPDGSVTYLPLP